MKLKIVKPKPKYYKISYAMLSNHLQPQSQPQKTSSIPQPQKSIQQEKKLNFVDEYEKIVDLAIRKGMVDEDEREIKALELRALSEEDFETYKQQVQNEVSAKIETLDEEEDDNLTEAEKVLAKIRKSGPIIGDFTNVNQPSTYDTGGFDSGTRSLKDIGSKKLDYTNIKSEEQLMQETMEDISAKIQKQIVAKRKNPMANLKGLTKPIVQQQSQFEYGRNGLANKLSDLNWSFGKR